jgi:hypothetical protein
VRLSTERLARNQALFREINERINEVRSPAVALNEFVCECSNPSCTQSLLLAPSEYQAVRSNPTHFLIARGHEMPDVELVVEDHSRFLVVKKTVETEFMAESDPRSREGG